MARLTYHVVQRFVLVPPSGYLGAASPISAPDSKTAARLAQKMPEGTVGAIAFSRTGDPETGEWDDAVIFERLGRVLEDDDSGDLPW